MIIRTALAFPAYVLISGVLFAIGVLVSIGYDYNMLNRPLQFASTAIILAGPVACGVIQYALGRRWTSSPLSLWGGVAAAVFLAPLIGIACAFLIAEYWP